jgi:hypothetical protein
MIYGIAEMTLGWRWAYSIFPDISYSYRSALMISMLDA